MSWDPSQGAVSPFKWFSLLVVNGKSEKEDYYQALVKGREAVALSPSSDGNTLCKQLGEKSMEKPLSCCVSS